MSPSFTSSAAICTLSVPSSVLEKDVVLQLVLHLASDKQVAVKQTKKGADLSLALSSGHVMTQRGAILRALAGPVLMYALDIPLLGGHGAASKNAGQVKSIWAMSSMHSYMTVAHQLRTGKSDKSIVLSQLESYLEEHSFLIPSSSATLADMEVATALLFSSPSQDQDNYSPNVMRWLTTVHAQMIQLGAKGLPAVTSPPTPLPVFFYGTEAFAASADSTTPSSAAPPGTGTKGAAVATTTTTTNTKDGAPKVPPAADASSSSGGGLSDEQKKAAADKRAKKAALKATKKPAAAATPTAGDGGAGGGDADLNIMALDIRVGKIIKAWHHADAEKLFCEEIDVGEGSPRQIASGLRPFYKTEDLEGRHVLVLCNLKSRNLVGFPSHGMVLCASNADHTAVEFVVPPPDVPLGERVVFGTLTGDAEPENKVAKKKFVEKLLPDLKTTTDGIVVWKDHTCNTTKGPVKALNGMPMAQVG